MEIHKIGGEAIEKFLKNIPDGSFILVHGGGNRITEALKEKGIPTKYVRGQRYTDKRAIGVVADIMDKVRRRILEKMPDKTVGIRGDEFGFLARRIKNLGFVGEVVDFPAKLIEKIIRDGYKIVISPLAKDKNGNTLNINADVFASSLCKKLNVKKIKFWVDTDGILDEDAKILKEIDKKKIKLFLKKGIINKGMFVKVNEAIKCKNYGVKEVFIGETKIL